MSEMQCAGRQQSSSLVHILMLLAIMERQMSRRGKYILSAKAVKCLDKLWSEDGFVPAQLDSLARIGLTSPMSQSL